MFLAKLWTNSAREGENVGGHTGSKYLSKIQEQIQSS